MAAAARRPSALRAAIVAGQVAGLAMTGTLSLAFTLARGEHLGIPLQAAASVFVGGGALAERTAGIVVIGTLAGQLGPALCWSLVFVAFAFALLLRRRAASVLLGLATSTAAMLVDGQLLPAVAAAFGSDDLWTRTVPPLWNWLAHLAYGGALGFLFADQRSGRAARRPAATSLRGSPSRGSPLRAPSLPR